MIVTCDFTRLKTKTPRCLVTATISDDEPDCYTEHQYKINKILAKMTT